MCVCARGSSVGSLESRDPRVEARWWWPPLCQLLVKVFFSGGPSLDFPENPKRQSFTNSRFVWVVLYCASCEIFTQSPNPAFLYNSSCTLLPTIHLKSLECQDMPRLTNKHKEKKEQSTGGKKGRQGIKNKKNNTKEERTKEESQDERKKARKK